MSSQSRGGWIVALLSFLPLCTIFAQAAPGDATRKTPASAKKADADETSVAITHRQENEGWRCAETANFLLFHRHTRALAESVLRTAERVRSAQQRKWFGAVGDNWSPKCRICLYPSGEAYGEATGAPVNAGGGQTEIQTEEGRVLSRCIHLHGSQSFLLRGVVPHEVTHAVLAGRLGGERVPRWADEGMAILAETQSHIDVHYRHLPRWRADDALFTIRDLVEMRDYPQPRSLGVFYAQSVSLVDFLTREKGAKRFAVFVREAERAGYAASLRKHYGWSFAELDRRWQRHVFSDDKATETTTANGGG
jgi:hypothetical protein